MKKYENDPEFVKRRDELESKAEEILSMLSELEKDFPLDLNHKYDFNRHGKLIVYMAKPF